MLKQKQSVWLRARQNGRFGLFLQIECGGVINAAETFDFQGSLLHQFGCDFESINRVAARPNA
jgi:hypothetical protein